MSINPHPQHTVAKAVINFKTLTEEGRNYLAFREALRHLGEPEQRISFARTVIGMIRDKNYEGAWEFGRTYSNFSTPQINRLLVEQRLHELLKKSLTEALAFAEKYVKNTRPKTEVARMLYAEHFMNKRYEKAATIWNRYELGPKRKNIAAHNAFVHLRTDGINRYIDTQFNTDQDKIKALEEIRKEFEAAIALGKIYPRAIKKSAILNTIRAHAQVNQMIFSISHGLQGHIPFALEPLYPPGREL